MLRCEQARASDNITGSTRHRCIPDILIVYASALSAETAMCCTGSVIMESPPPAQPIKISPQSSVSKFSSVLPAMYISYWQYKTLISQWMVGELSFAAVWLIDRTKDPAAKKETLGGGVECAAHSQRAPEGQVQWLGWPSKTALKASAVGETP